MPKIRVCFQGDEDHVITITVGGDPTNPSNNPTLASLRRDFPFKGSFHFRLRSPSPCAKFDCAWRDLVDESHELVGSEGNLLIKAIPADLIDDDYELNDEQELPLEDDLVFDHFSTFQASEPTLVHVGAASPAVQRTKSEVLPASKSNSGMLASPSSVDPVAAFSKSLFSGARAALEAVKKNVAGTDPYAN